MHEEEKQEGVLYANGFVTGNLPEGYELREGWLRAKNFLLENGAKEPYTLEDGTVVAKDFILTGADPEGDFINFPD